MLSKNTCLVLVFLFLGVFSQLPSYIFDVAVRKVEPTTFAEHGESDSGCYSDGDTITFDSQLSEGWFVSIYETIFDGYTGQIKVTGVNSGVIQEGSVLFDDFSEGLPFGVSFAMSNWADDSSVVIESNLYDSSDNIVATKSVTVNIRFNGLLSYISYLAVRVDEPVNWADGQGVEDGGIITFDGPLSDGWFCTTFDNILADSSIVLKAIGTESGYSQETSQSFDSYSEGSQLCMSASMNGWSNDPSVQVEAYFYNSNNELLHLKVITVSIRFSSFIDYLAVRVDEPVNWADGQGVGDGETITFDSSSSDGWFCTTFENIFSGYSIELNVVGTQSGYSEDASQSYSSYTEGDAYCMSASMDGWSNDDSVQVEAYFFDSNGDLLHLKVIIVFIEFAVAKPEVTDLVVRLDVPTIIDDYSESGTNVILDGQSVIADGFASNLYFCSIYSSASIGNKYKIEMTGTFNYGSNNQIETQSSDIQTISESNDELGFVYPIFSGYLVSGTQLSISSIYYDSSDNIIDSKTITVDFSRNNYCSGHIACLSQPTQVQCSIFGFLGCQWIS